MIRNRLGKQRHVFRAKTIIFPQLPTTTFHTLWNQKIQFYDHQFSDYVLKNGL